MDGLFLRRLDFPNEVVDCPDRYLNIYQKYVGDVGCVVWDAALVLLHYLFTESGNKFIHKKHVLELGAGTGAVGLASIIAGSASVIITDLPKHLQLMELNIKENMNILCEFLPDVNDLEHVQAHVLQWGNKTDLERIFCDRKSSQIQCVLIADCIYYDEGMLKLYDTILMILNNVQNSCNVLCCYEVRNTPEKVKLLKSFMGLIRSNPSLGLSAVPYSEMDEQYRSDDIHIVVISKSSL